MILATFNTYVLMHIKTVMVSFPDQEIDFVCKYIHMRKNSDKLHKHT